MKSILLTFTLICVAVAATTTKKRQIFQNFGPGDSGLQTIADLQEVMKENIMVASFDNTDGSAEAGVAYELTMNPIYSGPYTMHFMSGVVVNQWFLQVLSLTNLGVNISLTVSVGGTGGSLSGTFVPDLYGVFNCNATEGFCGYIFSDVSGPYSTTLLMEPSSAQRVIVGINGDSPAITFSETPPANVVFWLTAGVYCTYAGLIQNGYTFANQE